MSRVDDMLASGLVTQDPESEKRVIFNVPLYLPKIVIENGGFELFASAFGWEAIVNGTLNSQPAHEKAIEIIWDFVNSIFDEEFIKLKEKQAALQAKQELNLLKQKD
jgi:hypothetical protein